MLELRVLGLDVDGPKGMHGALRESLVRLVQCDHHPSDPSELSDLGPDRRHRTLFPLRFGPLFGPNLPRTANFAGVLLEQGQLWGDTFIRPEGLIVCQFRGRRLDVLYV